MSDIDRLRFWEAAHQRRDGLEEQGRWAYAGDRSDPERATPEGHTRHVTTCTFSPEGRSIVSGGLDGTLKLWDAETGRCEATLEGHGGEIFACAFSPDGRRLVSGSADHTLQLRDAEAGRCQAILKGHGGPIRACAFSPDSQTIVSGSDDKSLKFWQAPMGVEVGISPSVLDVDYFLQPPPTGHTAPVTSCAFSPDGRRVVSASGDGTLKLWNAWTHACEATLEGHGAWVAACAYSPSGETIVSAGHDKALKLWDAHTCTQLGTLEGHTDKVTACAYSPDGETIISASEDKTLRLWDAHSGAELLSLSFADGLLTCAFSPLGRRVCCGGSGGSVYILELSGRVSARRVTSRRPEPFASGSGDRDGETHD